MIKSLTFIFLILSINLKAQDQTADHILDQLQKETLSCKNISIKFEFIFENKTQKIKDIQSGKLNIEGEKFILELNEQIIINDGESNWLYLKDLNEVQISEHDPEDEFMNINKTFNIYKKNYKTAYIQEETKNKIKYHIIDLFPKESGSFIKKRLTINALKNQIKEIEIFDKNGGTYSYKILSFLKNEDIQRTYFFNVKNYPDVEIIDLR